MAQAETLPTILISPYSLSYGTEQISRSHWTGLAAPTKAIPICEKVAPLNQILPYSFQRVGAEFRYSFSLKFAGKRKSETYLLFQLSMRGPQSDQQYGLVRENSHRRSDIDTFEQHRRFIPTHADTTMATHEPRRLHGMHT